MGTKKTSEKKSVRTTVSIPADDYAELERIANTQNVSVAWVVRESVRRLLDAESPLFRLSPIQRRTGDD